MPEFVYGDVQLAFTIDGEATGESFPNKGDGYKASNVTCENGVTAEWNNHEWGLVNVNASDNKKIKCSIDFVTATEFADLVKIGDYVSMTPTATTAPIPSALTGYSSDQSVESSELNLWRVIRINPDGTIEMVSEYVSSTTVYFSGETGYRNLVGTLNFLAAAYGNSKYTIATRHIGYNAQTATLSSAFSQASCGTSSTTNNSKETSGCGDTLYETDTNLVKTAVGTLVANKVTATTSATPYWLASRSYVYYGSTNVSFSVRHVNAGGSPYAGDLYYYSNGGWREGSAGRGLRPIVTLRSGVSASSGSGSSSSPWVLS